MLDSVIGNYIDTLSEREFDAPFMALLRSLGYHDIHYLHGQFEFGKDFIAKLDEGNTSYQFAFQTKAGNLNLGAWSEVRGQIDMLRTNLLAHPNFDAMLPRRAILVTTGRLTGGAPAAAQDYSAHLRQLNEGHFELWDRETLIELMGHSPQVGLAGIDTSDLLAGLGAVETSKADDRNIEQLSRRWCDPVISLSQATIEAALLAHRLRAKNRTDLACFTCLCLLRGVLYRTHGRKPPDAASAAFLATSRAMFKHYAMELWNACTPVTLEPEELLNGLRMPTLFVTYPVLCCRLTEIISLLAILVQPEVPELTCRIADYLETFWKNHPAARHPISDRWAVSLLPPAILLTNCSRAPSVSDHLKQVTKWVADHYDQYGFGLAGPRATVKEEVDYLLGASFEHVDITPRSESYLSTILLDLAAITEDGELYNLARNEFLAAGINSCLLESPDTPEQYVSDSPDLTWEANVPFVDAWQPQNSTWMTAPHHVRSKEPFWAEQIGALWDQLAISTVLRDRHFIGTCRQLITIRR